jgi:hypothetical protein
MTQLEFSATAWGGPLAAGFLGSLPTAYRRRCHPPPLLNDLQRRALGRHRDEPAAVDHPPAQPMCRDQRHQTLQVKRLARCHSDIWLLNTSYRNLIPLTTEGF